MEGMLVDPGGEQGSFVSLLNGCTLTGDKNGCTAAHWAAYKDFQWTSDEFGVLYHKQSMSMMWNVYLYMFEGTYILIYYIFRYFDDLICLTYS